MKTDPAERVFHRQMYIDLIRAYLVDYGTQTELARALGISVPLLNYYLTPVRTEDSVQNPFWPHVAGAKPSVLKQSLSVLRTPPSQRAEEITSHLGTDDARREVLLYHIERARATRVEPSQRTDVLLPEELHREMSAIGSVHELALRAIDPDITGIGYWEVWRTGRDLVSRVDARSCPLQYVQLLMYLHDAAGVINRPDLALGFAREATLVLSTDRVRPNDELAARKRVNAVLAEMVTLNALGLSSRALEVAMNAKALPEYDTEPWNWRRSFLEQTVRAYARSSRFSIGGVEYIAEEAKACAQHDPELTLGIDSYLVSAYLIHSSVRDSAKSLRRAASLVDDLRSRIAFHHDLNPLRRVRFLRVAVSLYEAKRDYEERDATLRLCLHLMARAGMAHQADELERI